MDPQLRIMNHMNKDHFLSLEDYLAVYGNEKITKYTDDIYITEFELDHMVLSYTERKIAKQKTIKFDPPIESFGESRERLVDMAKEAASKRGYSHLQLTQVYYPEKAIEMLNIGLFALVLLGFASPQALQNAYTSVMYIPESIASVLVSYNDIVLYFLLIVHLLEYVFVLHPILKKFRADGPTKLEYFGMCLLEGFFVLRRVKKVLYELEHPKKH